MKYGVILAGGHGTRLRPLTYITNKHLIAVYNKPMVEYPLQTLISAGMKDILIVSGGENIGSFAEYLKDGANYGVKLTYKVQTEAGGIAQALSLAEDFAQGEDILVILGDNIFAPLKIDPPEPGNACLWLKEVEKPERFGVAEIKDGKLVGIEEKPTKPKTSLAVTGLYYYPPEVFDFIKTLKPSARGELEITDVNNYFISKDRCEYRLVDNFWSDSGTFESLLTSSLWASMQV